MSLALYRKYRPATFAEVKGQDHVTVPLRQALRNGRVHHAYLFSGPRGCGKTSSARILARSLNCEQGPTPDPCGVCDSCVALAPNGAGSLDVVEIDAASHGGVDDARDLRERAFYAPVSSRFKVYIIDEAHMVSREGFNALLKLVEEPPDFLRFVFATTEPEKVLQTIRSRTHHYPFRLMPRGDLTALLAEVVAAEGIDVEPAVLPLVVRAAAGSARDGLSILDQVMSSSGEGGVTRAAAAGLLGVTPDTLLDDVVDAFAAADAAAVFATVDAVMEGGHDPRRFAQDVLERLRDLIVLDAVPEAGAKDLLDCPPDQLERMGRQARLLGTAGLSRTADLLHAGLVEMRGTTAPRLLLELLCARVLLPAATSDNSALLSRLERLELRLDIGAPAPTAPLDLARRRGPEHPSVEQPRSADRVPAPVITPAPAPIPARAAAAGPGSAPVVGPAPAAGAAAAAPPLREPRSARSGTDRPGAAAGAGDRPDAPATDRPGAAAGAGADRAPVAESSAWPTTAVLGGGSAQSATSSPLAVSEPAPSDRAAPADSGALPDGGFDAAALRRSWDEVLHEVRSRKRTTHALLLNAQVVGVSGRTATLVFTTAALLRQFESSTNTEVLKEALVAALGVDLEFVCRSGDATQPGSGHAGGGPAAARAADGPGGAPRPAVRDATADTAPPGSPIQGFGSRGAATRGPSVDNGQTGGPAAGDRAGGSRRPARQGAYEDFAPGDEAEPEDEADAGPRMRPEEAALDLVQRELGGKVVGTLMD